MPQTQPQRLDYATPTTRRFLFSMPAFLFTLMLMLAIFILLGDIVREFAMIYADFKTNLPTFTSALIDFSHFYARVGWVPTIALPILIGFVVARKEEQPSWITWAMLLMLVGTILLFTIIAKAILSPMFLIGSFAN
jgi:type II secretory pathway component PulF